MKKFGLFVLFIALVLSACSQYQPQRTEIQSITNLRNIIQNSKAFDSIVGEETTRQLWLELDWNKAVLDSYPESYSVTIPNASRPYVFYIVISRKYISVEKIKLLKYSNNLDSTISVIAVDISSLEASHTVFSTKGEIISKSRGIIDNLNTLPSITSIKKQKMAPSILETLSNNYCLSEARDARDAIQYLIDAKDALEDAENQAALAALGIMGCSTGAAGCVAGVALYIYAKGRIASLRSAVREAEVIADDYNKVLERCLLAH